MRPIISHHGPLSPSISYHSSKFDSNEDNFNRLTWRGLSGTIGAGSFYPPNGSGASFWTRVGVDGTSTLVPTIFWTHACYCMCRRSNAIVSTIRVSYSGKFVDCGRRRGHRRILLKEHSRILFQRRSEESMKIDLPKKVQHNYEYATVCFSIWRSRIWRQNRPDVRIG